MNGDDIVRYIVTETLTAAGLPTSGPCVDGLVSRFLREFGGERVYLPQQDRRLVMETRARIFEVALSSREPTDVLARREGIGRATLYRLLKRGPPQT